MADASVACAPLAASASDAGAANIPGSGAGCTADKDCPAGKYCAPTAGGTFACGSPTAQGASAGDGNGGHRGNGGACETELTLPSGCDSNALAWTASIDVSRSPGSLVESDSVLAADGKGTVVAAWSSLPFPGTPVQQLNRMAVSHDDGITFSSVTAPVDSSTSAANDATLAYDSSGHWYYVWEAYESDFQGAQHVWMSTSTDAEGWSSPFAIDAPADSASSQPALDFPWVAVNPVNHDVYVSYQASSATANGSEHLVVLGAGATVDGGAHPGADAGEIDGGAAASFPLSDGTRPGNYADLARGVFDSSGSFYAAWVELVDASTEYGGAISGSTENAIYFTRVDLVQGGLAQAIPNVKVNGATDAITFDGPSIAVDASAAYVAYAVGTNDAIDVVVAKSTDRGASWSAAVKVNDDAPCATHFHPTLASDASGSLYVFWYDNRDGYGHFFYSVSTDGGATFSPNRLVSAPRFPFDTFQYSTGWLGDYFEPAVAWNELYVLWNDGREADQSHAYFAKSVLR